MVKITFIGAGSTVFAKRLIGDILSFPELANSEIYLYDIDPDRLKTSEIVAHKVAQTLNVQPKIVATTDRRFALEGTDYAICMIQVGGYKPATVIDFEIPKRYGLRQTISDTLGVGGIMRALRTIPVLLDMCKEMESICPDALLLNYVNPLAMNCWAINQGSKIRTIGLCHSVPNTIEELAEDVGIPINEINYLVAGINHMAFFLKLQRGKQDIYPLVQKVIDEGRVPAWNRVRYEIFQRLGYFVTESSEHFSEYVPWFIKRDRPDLIKRYNIPLDEYITRCEDQISKWETLRDQLEHRETPLEVVRSSEYASEIIHSIETGCPRVIYGNLPNYELIENLPPSCCVEVPCLVDENGIQPTRIGCLPPQLAAVMQTNINVQSLTVEAALTGNHQHVFHAAMLDPHTAAELDLDQIWEMVNEMIAAHQEWNPGFLN